MTENPNTSTHQRIVASLLHTKVSGDEAELARRYATALFALAGEKGSIDQVSTEMVGLAQLWAQKDVAQFFANPRLTKSQRHTAIQALMDKAAFGQLVSHLAGLLAERRRLNCVPAIVRAFLRLVADSRGLHYAVMRAAYAVTPAQLDRLTKELSSMVSGTVELSVEHDVTLMGGFTVQIGDRFIDRSVKSALTNLERQLTSSSTLNLSKGAA